MLSPLLSLATVLFVIVTATTRTSAQRWPLKRIATVSPNVVGESLVPGSVLPHMAKGPGVCDYSKGLEMGDFPGLSMWVLNVTTSILVRGRRNEMGHRGGKEMDDVSREKLEDSILLASTVEDEATRQGIQELENTGRRFSPVASRNMVLRTLDFSPGKPISGLWPPEPSEHKCVLF